MSDHTGFGIMSRTGGYGSRGSTTAGGEEPKEREYPSPTHAHLVPQWAVVRDGIGASDFTGHWERTVWKKALRWVASCLYS